MLMTPDAGHVDINQVSEVVDYWTRPDVVQVFNEHRRWLILNIANEAGTTGVNGPNQAFDREFSRVYRDAIRDIRATGLRIPLVIDAANFGTDRFGLWNTWEGLRDSDPESNLLFSMHTYFGGSMSDREFILNLVVNEARDMNIPMIFGEGPQGNSDNGDGTCSFSPWELGLDLFQENEFGWLIWSWGAAPNTDCRDANGENRFDLTAAGQPFVDSNGLDFSENGEFENWNTDFAEQLLITHPNSLQKTSRRPAGLR